MAQTPGDFIALLFCGASEQAHIEFRLIGNNTSKQTFFSIADFDSQWAAIEAKLASLNKKGFNIYFGAHPRTVQWAVFWQHEGKEKHKAFRDEAQARQHASGFKPATNPRVVRAVLGEAENVVECYALYADLDYKGPLVKQNCAVLKGFNLSPTFMVDSGHGYHLWWRLKEPCTPEVATQTMQQIARVLAGDHVWDPPRVMRLPGTLNVKVPTAPLPCSIVWYDTTRAYCTTDFDVLADCAAGVWPPGKQPPAKQGPPAVTPAAKGAPTAAPAKGAGPAMPAAPPASLVAYGNGHGFAMAMAQAIAPYWNAVPNTRHKLAMGLAGLLRKNEVPEEGTAYIVAKVCALARDDEAEDRAMVVKTTYAADINSIASSTYIKEALGDERAKGFFRAYNTVIEHIPPPPTIRTRLPNFDFAKCVPQGIFFDRYIKYASSKTDAPLQYHTASIITAVAAALGNNIYVDDFHGKRLYPNLYTLLCGPSTRLRKSNSILMTKPISKTAGIEIYPSNATVELLYARLAPEPTDWVDKQGNPCGRDEKGAKATAWYGQPSGIFYHSEFSHYLSSSAKSYMQDSRNFFMDLYDGAPGGDTRETKTQGKYVIENASISMLCGVTLATIKAFVSREDIQNGFLARFLIIMPPSKHQNRYGRNRTDNTSDLDTLSDLSDYLKALSEIKGPVTVSPGADALYTEFDREMHTAMERHENTEKEAMSGFLGRLSTMAFKVATIYGCATRLMPIIDDSTMQHAINMCRYSAAGLEFFFDEIKAGEARNIELQQEDKVVRAVRRAWQNGERPVSQTTIYRACHLTADQTETAIQSACRKGLIYPDPGGRAKRYILHEIDATGQDNGASSSGGTSL